MTVQSVDDIQGLQRVGQVGTFTLKTMQAALTPGITTAALDQIGRHSRAT